jgi:hypothetical protein
VKKSITLFVIVVAISSIIGGPSFAAIYVSPNGDDSDGQSWTTALHDINAALLLAEANQTDVWVAQATCAVNSSITVPSNVALYGGFPQTGNPVFADRNPTVYLTSLDGQGAVGNIVVFQSVAHARIDGFTIRGGSGTWNGGGIYCWGGSTATTVANCVLCDNSSDGGGGAATVYLSTGITFQNCQMLRNHSGQGGALRFHQADAIIHNCTFEQNDSTVMGGGISDYDSTLEVDACLFHGNQSVKGGGIHFDQGSRVSVKNSLFVANVSTQFGASIAMEYQQDANVVNCTFVDNSAGTDGGGVVFFRGTGSLVNSVFANNNKQAVYDGDCNPHIPVNNCLFFANPDAVYFNIATGTILDVVGLNLLAWAEGNVAADPSFVDPVGGDYHLKYDSPCIDAASGSAPTLDMDGHTRPYDVANHGGSGQNAFDIGCYELVLNPLDDTDGDGVSNGQEATWGTDPLDPEQWPELPAAGVAGLAVMVLLILAHSQFRLAKPRGRKHPIKSL